jgi:hypothetical protein
MGACNTARAHLELLKGLVLDWESVAIPAWNVTGARQYPLQKLYLHILYSTPS